MTTLELLKAARERIADESRWCKGHLTAKADNSPCFPFEEPERWCAYGAIFECNGFGKEASQEAEDILDGIAREMGHGNIVTLNDDTDHKTVLSVFDEAIRRASQ